MLKLNLNSSQSDPLINTYFDFYLKLFALFGHDIKYRKQFIFLASQPSSSAAANEQARSAFESASMAPISLSENTEYSSLTNWQLVDQDGDLESPEQLFVEISEDDLVKLYYQFPFNHLYSFLWQYLKFQAEPGDNAESASKVASSGQNSEFRKRYVALKILSFLDCLVRLCETHFRHHHLLDAHQIDSLDHPESAKHWFAVSENQMDHIEHHVRHRRLSCQLCRLVWPLLEQ